MSTTEQQIEAFEKERLAAIARSDVAAMQQMLADDYVHVNSTGRVIDKATFISKLGRARETTRGPLTIRVYDDTAIVIGEQTNATEASDKSITTVNYVVTQVMRRNNDRWQLSLMQLTQKEAKGK